MAHGRQGWPVVSRKWSLLKRHCPLCRAPRWIITDPDGMQRGCLGDWELAAALTVNWAKPA